ncbi:MAG: 16S rRNA (uracil(1498)-N(3))-methyltransferase [Spirochaetaceae bacterium]|nr:16S rRNA (uracil(1498)-N(3))-methyltransferase [Spirochaetaceae bacterium]
MWYTFPVNIILFEAHELDRPLSRRDERALHLLKVLRKKPGDPFEAGVLGGRRGTGRIEAVGPDGSVAFSLDLRDDPPPRLPIRLAVGFPRPIQLRRLLRDLSTLGIGEIDLVGAELGEKSYRDTKLLSDGGARTALIEGAVQARDTRLPRLAVYPALAGWLRERPWASPPASLAGEALRAGPLLIAADNVNPGGSMARLAPLSPGQALVLAIGPERGWSDRERAALEAAGFLRLSLGRRCLRTETACVAAVILAMEKTGEFG